jgi:hypothetical protein
VSPGRSSGGGEPLCDILPQRVHRDAGLAQDQQRRVAALVDDAEQR